MDLYLSVVKFNWLKVITYPFEIIAFFACRFAALGFLALFWYAVSRSAVGSLDFRSLVAYFLVAAAVKDLSFSTDLKFAKAIQLVIRNGEISNYFIKPVQTIPFLFASFVGDTGLGLIYALVTLTLGLIILPPLTLINILAFLIFLALALVFSLCFNTLVGLLAFFSPEADGFRNAINHVVRILSGSLIPLNLFPATLRNIVLLLPFPALVFTPTYVLQNSLTWGELASLFVVTLIWGGILIILTKKIWLYAIKRYEGVGI